MSRLFRFSSHWQTSYSEYTLPDTRRAINRATAIAAPCVRAVIYHWYSEKYRNNPVVTVMTNRLVTVVQYRA
jgi:hypothetical protein